MRYKHTQKGISVIEVIVVAAIVAIFFSGLFASFYYTISLIQDSKARQTALSVAHNHMEYIRSLSYNAVGTVAGIPAGNIPQVATTTLNGIEFTIRTLIEYVDDPADGLGVDDINNITTDYKTAKVTVDWVSRGASKELFLVSRVVPRSIETDVGGGTLRVNVFDANVLPLPGATVRLINTTGTSIIDVTRTTNVDGIALFGGAPAGAGYEVEVTKPGYSTDGTRAITGDLVSPASPPAAVAEADITTLNFFIDELSNLTIKTVSGRTEATFIESFASSTALATSSGVVVVGEEVLLAESAGVYESIGTADLLPIVPASIVSWGSIAIADDIPGLTARTLQILTNDSIPTLIPDSILPGNSSGLTASIIDLSAVDATIYPGIILRFALETADTSVTPSIQEVEVSYISAETVLPNISFELIGSKSIGNNASGTPIMKFSTTTNSGSTGEIIFSNIEWDTYVASSTYTLTEACPAHPMVVAPGTNQIVTLTLTSFSPNALRMVVTDSNNNPQSAVAVRLTRPGYDETMVTSICGQASFTGLASEDDYELTLSVDGTPVWNETDFSINGQQVNVIQLP